MKKPFLRYGDGKSPEALYPVRISGQVAYLCIPLSESGKDFMVAEAETALRSAIEARIHNPRVLATTVLDAWLKAARGPNGRGEVVEALAGYGITELNPPEKSPYPIVLVLLENLADLVLSTVEHGDLRVVELDELNAFRASLAAFRKAHP